MDLWLTCYDKNDASSHSNTGLLYFVISPTACALHAHRGHEHSEEAQHQRNHH